MKIRRFGMKVNDTTISHSSNEMGVLLLGIVKIYSPLFLY